MAENQHIYAAIDLKSFYASVECVSRKLDTLTTNLVVADVTRSEKTICLAVSPSLKACGIPGRPRLFEVVQKVREVNRQRLADAVRAHKAVRGADGKWSFASSSFDAAALQKDLSLELGYIVAPPRMATYIEYSTRISCMPCRDLTTEVICLGRRVIRMCARMRLRSSSSSMRTV